MATLARCRRSARYGRQMKGETKMQLLAVIREEDCIGCTKCIQACPVDAILGATRKMHTVISEECIGCKLCIPPCPVDCIELIHLPAPELTSEQRQHRSAHIKKRYVARQQRLKSAAQPDLHVQKTYIQGALSRVKKNKSIQ